MALEEKPYWSLREMKKVTHLTVIGEPRRLGGLRAVYKRLDNRLTYLSHRGSKRYCVEDLQGIRYPRRLEWISNVQPPG
jgi:hypothetical protein